MASKNREIISKVLAMDEGELRAFLAKLNPEAIEYLDIIIEKETKKLNK